MVDLGVRNVKITIHNTNIDSFGQVPT